MNRKLNSNVFVCPFGSFNFAPNASKVDAHILKDILYVPSYSGGPRRIYPRKGFSGQQMSQLQFIKISIYKFSNPSIQHFVYLLMYQDLARTGQALSPNLSSVVSQGVLFSRRFLVFWLLHLLHHKDSSEIILFSFSFNLFVDAVHLHCCFMQFLNTKLV